MTISYISGLPRSGSTLLCNLLNLHKNTKVSSSSPLPHLVQGLRKSWSDDTFLLSQLDKNFDNVYDRLKRSTKSFIESWAGVKDDEIYFDKNRSWLANIEFIRHLYPDFKMIITLRDLRSVYASIENQHRKTLLLDFPDHMEHNIVDSRASALFDSNGLIGSIIKFLENIQDIPNATQHLYFFRFEDFLEDPQLAMDNLFEWFELDPINIDFDNIEQTINESDSYYRYKFRHNIKNKFEKPKDFSELEISPRILNSIVNRNEYFYKTYYPEVLNYFKQGNLEIDNKRNEIQQETEKELEKELENIGDQK